MGECARQMKRYSQEQIASLMFASLGEEKANALVRDAVASLGLGAGPYEESASLELLEHIAATPGIVGITARFAKARIHLLGSG